MSDPIVILGTGRCGSTLVQRLLNSSPKVLILGEHNGFLKEIAEAYFVLISSENVNKWVYGPGFDNEKMLAAARDPEYFSAWLNSFTRDRVKRHFGRLITDFLTEGLQLQELKWGFKEIRYGQNDRVLPMLSQLYPRASYIFVVRNVHDTIKSMLTAWMPRLPERFEEGVVSREDVHQVVMDHAGQWADKNENFLAFMGEQGDRSLLIRYEDLLSDPDKTVGALFRFIGMSKPSGAARIFVSKAGATSEKEQGKVVARWLEEEREPIAVRTARSAGQAGLPVQRCRRHKFKNVCGEFPEELKVQVQAVMKATKSCTGTRALMV